MVGGKDSVRGIQNYLTVARTVATDKHVIDRYFEMLVDTLNNNGLIHKLVQVYNYDVTGIPTTTKW